MREKEKMLAGKPYRASEEELLAERKAAKELIFEFNALHPSKTEQHNKIIQRLFGKTGKNFVIEPPFRCDYGYNISAGENFYANYNCTIIDCAQVTIGDNVFIAPNVSLFTAGHPVHPEVRNTQLEYAIPIFIGNNVWLGGGAIVNPGVTIGDNTVIGSGSVVTKDIPANVIAVGNPCRVKRKITEKDKINFLEMLSLDKKILILTGSPWKNGNSDMLADAFMKGAREKGLTINKIEVAKLNVSGCNACDKCWTMDRACVQCDDMAEIEPLLESADMLVLVSPLYFMGFPHS